MPLRSRISNRVCVSNQWLSRLHLLERRRRVATDGKEAEVAMRGSDLRVLYRALYEGGFSALYLI